MINSYSENCYFPLEHLSVIEVCGEDAPRFLQGQLTCNIDQLTPDKASFAAYCTAKGRVISTLIIIKRQHDFQIILPSSLLEKVRNKLQLYVLRSKVELHDQSTTLRLIGLSFAQPIAELAFPELPMAVKLQPFPVMRLPSIMERYVCLLENAAVAEFISQLEQKGFKSADSASWRFLDITSGIPWFELPQSELYIPQMLNLDRFDGISFNKGCYTGQEIVARTHYLGQHKRELYMAEADKELPDTCLDQGIIDPASQLKIGTVLAKQNHLGRTHLILVLQTVDDPTKNLILDDADHTVLQLNPTP